MMSKDYAGWKMIFISLGFISLCFACQSGSRQNDNLSPMFPGYESSLYIYASETTSKDSIRLKIPNYLLQNQKDLDVLMEQIGDARVVLLGEATHGTAEFYNWRAAITKRLIQEKGFDFIASESEWADSYRVNNFIKGAAKDSAQVVGLLKQYDRWPT